MTDIRAKEKDVYIYIYIYHTRMSGSSNLDGPPHMAEQKQDDQLKHTYSSSVRKQDVDHEDLLETTDDRERWQERFRDICASGTTR